MEAWQIIDALPLVLFVPMLHNLLVEIEDLSLVLYVQVEGAQLVNNLANEFGHSSYDFIVIALYY